MKILIATGNKNKVREIGQILNSEYYDLISMEDAGISCEIIEDGDSFMENSRIKARTVKKYWDGIVIADDSGLVIDALGGKPGIMSARFMGENTSYITKCEAILREMENVPDGKRNARFVCAITAIMPDGREICIEENFEGEIAKTYEGENGFGYDPIFYVPQKNCTSAMLSEYEKNSISHRGKALSKLKVLLSPIRLITQEMKKNSGIMASASHEVRINALKIMQKMLKENKQKIFNANKKDIDSAKADGIGEEIIKRLKFDDDKLSSVLSGIDTLIKLPDPIGEVRLNRELSPGLNLRRVSTPIGVIGVIFEARPDALVQIAGLCVKSGNMCILKGGKETETTNRVIFDVLYNACKEAGLCENCLVKVSGHDEIRELLTCEETVDLIIPRGSNSFVKYIMDNTAIPVLGHADGICHTYVDSCVNLDMAVSVVIDAKTQYPAACNATETLLVAKSVSTEFLLRLYAECRKTGVNILGTREVADIIQCEIISDNDFKNEYLGLTLGVKLVDDVYSAVEHINLYGSHHTDAIITEDDGAWEYFSQRVDSAGVYRNASTRFADGFRYGFGAEVGISTSKIHARGPVGLFGLMTYKYLLEGEGHIVKAFEAGEKFYTFKDFD